MRARRLAEGAVALCCASGLLTLIGAQLTPGWQLAEVQPPLNPRAHQPDAGARSAGVTQLATEVEVGLADPLPAWILLPSPDDTGALIPGVVVVPGSGSQPRDALLAEARALASSGVAAIVYAKRVAGYSIRQRDYVQLADDAIQAADVLAAQPGVDPQRIGILGFSEGGWVAPTAVARRADRFAFIILVSAPVVTPLQQTVWMVDQRLAAWPGWLRRVPATVLATGRPWLGYLDYDVRSALRSVRIPVYAVWGADDPTVPVTAAVRQVQESVPGPVSVVVLAGSGHRPRLETGWPDQAAQWIADPATVGSVTGSEPASAAGVPGVPRTSIVSSVLPLALSLVAAVAVGSRRHRDGVESAL